MDDDALDDWPTLLRDQHGIISRTQALQHGFTDAAILAQVAAGRWARAGHGTVATFTGPLTPSARRHAAMIAIAGPAALSHRTAGHVWGMLAGEWPDDERAEAHRALRVLGPQGVTSVLEARYVLDVETAHGLPRARHQTPFAVDTTTVFEDCLYSCPDGLVIVRLDGHRYHADRAVRLRDRRRGNAAEVAGRARLEYGWEEVTQTPCRVAVEVADVLRAHGWPGEVGACGACEHFLRS